MTQVGQPGEDVGGSFGGYQRSLIEVRASGVWRIITLSFRCLSQGQALRKQESRCKQSQYCAAWVPDLRSELRSNLVRDDDLAILVCN